MAKSSQPTFYTLLSQAVSEFSTHGFDSQKRLDDWLCIIERAARAILIPERQLREQLHDLLTRTFRRETSDRVLLTAHSGIDRFTLAAIKPKLRRELDRRILASASLIKLNREASIQRTLQRFAGWVTSVPIGGSNDPQQRKVAARIRKATSNLPYEERRVVVDQGHKLISAIDDIVARDGGAIAAEWAHVEEAGEAYDPRPQHVARNKKIYVLRKGWAYRQGLIKAMGNQFTDSITQPGEEINCRCRYRYIYNLRDLPAAMITKKGQAELYRVRSAIERMSYVTAR